MIVYVLIEEWCNGYDSNDSMMEIYATKDSAIHAQIVAEQANTDTDIGYRVDARPLIYG